MTTDRPCGPYRTTAGFGDAVGAGQLVYLHNHADEPGPRVHLPARNRANRWAFHEGGIAVDAAYADSLAALEREGFYRLREHFHPDQGRVVAANALVQLGYNRAAEPILFFPQVREDDNALVFPAQGMIIPASVYALLEPLDLRGPVAPVPVH